MNVYFKLMRVNHYVKNVLVFLGLLFSGLFFSFKFFEVFFVFLLFCIASSIVYVFNDIKDVDKDKLHFKKKFRPLPSGKLSLKQAWLLEFFLIILFFLLSFFLFLFFNNFKAVIIVLSYIVFNFFYTVYFKNVVLLDVFSIAFSFFLRVLAGTFGVGIVMSNWLFITIFFGSLFFAFDKRRVELLHGKSHRKILEKYNLEFLNFSVFFSIILSIVFYSLYVLLNHSDNRIFILSIVLLVVAVLKYLHLSFVMNKSSDFFENAVFDKELLFYTILFLLSIIVGLYYF